jgi:hypothetical protein
MKWILRYDIDCEENTTVFDDLGDAIEFAEIWGENEDHDRLRLFMAVGEEDHGDHVATYYPPRKGRWE